MEGKQIHCLSICFLLIFLLCNNSVYGKYLNRSDLDIQSDSVAIKKQIKNSVKNDIIKIGVVPGVFLAGSALTWNERENIRDMRNRYIPTFSNKFDDYIQYAPAMTVYALKLSGVKGRNNVGRSTLSYGASLGIMAILVNSIKYTTKVQRPDGSARNSFPSGHTAMAFANATYLHKEYGMINPMYSIAGYGTATFTGLGRGLNNRHWISDVLAGAGIGILSTQLGYFFMDKVFGNDGDNMSILSRFEGNENPSFLSIKLGYATATHNIVKTFEDGSYSKIGFEAGFEGCYYFSKYWGIGGDFSFTSFPITPSRSLTSETDPEFANVKMITQSMGTLNLAVGPYFAYGLSTKWLLQAKINCGISLGAKGIISFKFNNAHRSDELEIAGYKPSNTFKFGTGISLTYKMNTNLGITSYIDYHYLNPQITYSINEDLAEIDPGTVLYAKVKNRMDYIATGLRLTAFF